VRLERPGPIVRPNAITGQVVFVDDFGNLITNILWDILPQDVLDRLRVCIAGKELSRWVGAYAEAEKGVLAALRSSNGALEVALVQGSACKCLGVGVGAEVRVEWSP
jgi:S-adenosylmethionine hydrolase